MGFYPVFLSVVSVVHNQSDQLKGIIQRVSEALALSVSDYEFIIIDNASKDDSLETLKDLTGPSGYPNLQVYALTQEVESDTASWVGLERALGDFVAVIDPLLDDICFLDEMLEEAVTGIEVVFAHNQLKPRQSLAYQVAYEAFHFLYKTLNGFHLAKEAPQYRLFSKRVVNFIRQHPQPIITYQHLPVIGGFSRRNLEYRSKPHGKKPKKLGESINRGIRLLVATTRVPMRWVTWLSLFGATANLSYSVYVVVIGLIKTNVAPGWISLSLQQSGMFFLISIVLLVLGEYVLHMAHLNKEGPLYHVNDEFTSTRVIRQGKLNIEDASVLAKPIFRHSDQLAP